MIIWEVVLDNVSEFHGMKGDAGRSLRQHKKDGGSGTGPNKVVVKNREDLIELIDRIKGNEPESDEDEENEFV